MIKLIYKLIDKNEITLNKYEPYNITYNYKKIIILNIDKKC